MKDGFILDKSGRRIYHNYLNIKTIELRKYNTSGYIVEIYQCNSNTVFYFISTTEEDPEQYKSANKLKTIIEEQ